LTISPLIHNGSFAKVIQRRIRLSVRVFLSAIGTVQFTEEVHHPALLGHLNHQGLRSKLHHKLSSMTTTDEENVNSFDAEDKGRRRKKAYRVYKHYAKPTRASLCSIVDSHAEATGITRQDVDLLPWNPEETEVVKEAMKSLKKKKKKMGKEGKKGKKKKDKEEKERDGTEKTAFAKLKGKMGYISTNLDSSWNAISDSLDASSTSGWDQDRTQDHYEDKEHNEYLQTITVEEQHRRKREERRRKREEEKKKSFSGTGEQARIAAEEREKEDARNKIIQARQDDRLECTFLWYTRMAQPTRTEFERQIVMQNVDIALEDIDLLAWNESGTRVKNLAAMNAMLVRTRILKNSDTQLPALC
jgi:hypothetical protein